MTEKRTNTIKLGLFVVSGLAFLIFMLYMIGRNRNLFQSTYLLKAHVKNAQGLVTGNNVRYAGIEVGTVRRIKFLNDTLIEISLTINDDMSNIIRKNARVSIGSEGLVGNKVVNIASSPQKSDIALDGDTLIGSYSVNTEDMLLLLEKTNRDIASVAAGMRVSIERLNNSAAIWKILDDKTLAKNISMATENISTASQNAAAFTNDLKNMSASVKQGKGNIGMLLNDTAAFADMSQSLNRIRSAAENVDSFTAALNQYANEMHNHIENGNNTFNVLLKDSVVAGKLKASMNNIEKGTASFTTNMEALKHNILLRGYFRKLEKRNKKLQAANAVTKTNDAPDEH